MRTLLWLLLLVQRTGALLLPTRRPYSARPLVRPVRHTWCIADGGGGAGGPVNGSGGGGGGGDDDGDEDLLPSELLAALEAGRIGATELANWKNVISNPFTKALAASTFIRNRLLAEPRLTTILGMEITLGFLSTLAAEKAARGADLLKEIDFVLANLILVVLTNVALVLTLCPVAAVAPSPVAGTYAAWASRLPGFFLQKGDFSAMQRAACFFSKALLFSGVGAFTSSAGQAVTLGLVQLRTKLRPDDAPKVTLAPVLPTARAYAAFMAGSSNTRYQLVNSFEANVLPALPGPASLKASASFVLRTGNNYVGSANWIWWAKFNKLQ